VGTFKRFSAQTSNITVKDDKEKEKAESILEKVFEKAAEETSQNEIDWNAGMDIIQRTEQVLPPHKPTEEDLLKIRASRPTTTIASIINESETLKRLVDLGVNLYEWEAKGNLGLAVKLDFTRDVVPLITLLSDLGVPHDEIGSVLTRCPALLETSIEDLETRVLYLVSKQFTRENIVQIVTKNSRWLTFSVKGIDSRLGFMQKMFSLTGNEVRDVAVTCPRLITKTDLVLDVQKKIFCIKEEMGFSKDEMKEILLRHPMLFMKRQNVNLLAQFDLLHSQLSIPHDILCQFPESLRRSPILTDLRHLFLKHLGRAEYRPDQPGYISPELLTEGTDEEFCEKVAKCDIDLFYKFLKTQ